jgi:4-hydroxy-3-methylbut-2-enyl diphosphate reductase
MATREKELLPVAAPLHLLLATPRGFCAGVARAIDALEAALARFGPPLYVRHEIVHNPVVVESFRARGVVFVDTLKEVPDRARVLFSAHGVPSMVLEEARRRRLRFVDTTCPLVSKVHSEVAHYAAHGRRIVVIGHRDHVEVEGILGQVPTADVEVVGDVIEAEALAVEPGRAYAYVTQTTLSVDDTRAIIAVLKRRIPGLLGPRRADICYATTNRQTAVKALAPRCQAFLVLGGSNSSNANRLVETALAAGCPSAWLISQPPELGDGRLDGLRTVGATSAASTPDLLIDQLIAWLAARQALRIEEQGPLREDTTYKMPSLDPLA